MMFWNSASLTFPGTSNICRNPVQEGHGSGVVTSIAFIVDYINPNEWIVPQLRGNHVLGWMVRALLVIDQYGWTPDNWGKPILLILFTPSYNVLETTQIRGNTDISILRPFRLGATLIYPSWDHSDSRQHWYIHFWSWFHF